MSLRILGTSEDAETTSFIEIIKKYIQDILTLRKGLPKQSFKNCSCY